MPDNDLLPFQPPDAVHEAALVVLHAIVDEPPEATLVGDAEMFTTGAGTTVTVAFAFVLPPAPLQLNPNWVVVAMAGVVNTPLVGCEPDQPPDALQEVASVELHESCDACPDAIDVGFADKCTVGGDTDTGSAPVPPPPHAASSRTLEHASALEKKFLIDKLNSRRRARAGQDGPKGGAIYIPLHSLANPKRRH